MKEVIGHLALGLVPPIELAYIAGLIDGEGHFGIRVQEKKSGHTCIGLVIGVSNQHLETMEWVKSKIGGIIYKATSGKNVIYQMQIRHRNHIKWVITAIKPYLRIKKDEYLILEEACNSLLPDLGTRKGIDRSDAKLSHPDSYFEGFRILSKRLISLRLSKKEKV